MRYSSNKDLDALIRAAIADGYKFRHGSKHDQLRTPSGRLVVIPRTPSDWRSIKNVRRDLLKSIHF